MTTNKIDSLVAGLEASAAEIVAAGAQASQGHTAPPHVGHCAAPEEALFEAFRDQFAATLARAAHASFGTVSSADTAEDHRTIDGDFTLVDPNQPTASLHKETDDDR